MPTTCIVNPQRGLAAEAITNDQRAGLKPAPTTAPTRCANGRDPATSNRANTADRSGGAHVGAGLKPARYNGTDTLRERAGSGDFEPCEYSRPCWRSACRGGFQTRPCNGTDTLRERAGSGDFEPCEYSRPFWRSACRGGFQTRPCNGTDTLCERAGSGDFEPCEYSTPFWRSTCRGGFQTRPCHGLPPFHMASGCRSSAEFIWCQA